MTEKFHDYLYGSSFAVITDNNPLTYILTTAKLDATVQRCVASLSDYNFKIKYRSGKKIQMLMDYQVARKAIQGNAQFSQM